MPAQQDDLYAVLGVPATGSPDELARAYRRLCRRLHPDARPGESTAADCFAQVAAAYRVLVTMAITFWEAVTGTRLALRAAGDAPAEVEVPASTRSGDVLHVSNYGVPIGLNADARAAVEALARVLPCPRGGGGPAHVR